MSNEHAEKFYWFRGASVEELYGRIAAAGGPSHCRIEVRLHPGDKMMLRVVPEQDGKTVALAATPADINDSHVCPPFTDCPNA